jgi:hypothetical protein
MKKPDFTTQIAVNASPAEAMNRIARVDAWWAKNFKGSASKLHDRFTVDFGKTFVDFEVTVLVPGKKLVWTVTDCHLHWIEAKKEWLGNKICFELSPEGQNTRIVFTHLGLTPDAECFESCESGWTTHITQSLRDLINTGKGKPE